MNILYKIKTICLVSLMFFAMSCKQETSKVQALNADGYQGKKRMLSQINKDFPYDVDLKTPDQLVLNTKDIFRSNEKPLLIMYWMVTCAPCVQELNAVAQQYEKWKSEVDFNIAIVSIDHEQNHADALRVAANSWKFPSYWDINREIRYTVPGNINGLPQCVVIDKKGQIAYHGKKYLPGDEAKIFEGIKKAAATY